MLALMRRNLLTIFINVLTVSLSVSAAEPPSPKKVMITYFEPFGGASRNASEDVAKQLQSAKNLGADVSLCRLPVVYDQSGEEARKCYEKSDPKPAYVISLGEGDCTLRFETAAHNRDLAPGFPDNAGNVRDHKIINQGGLVSESMTFPIDELLCGSDLNQEERSLVTLSATPGGFVCNNTAYTMSRYFRSTAPLTHYEFVHVPSHKCGKTRSEKVSADILIKYIQTAIKRGFAEKSTAGFAFPFTLVDVDKRKSSLKNRETEVCQKAYLEEIRSKRVVFLQKEKITIKQVHAEPVMKINTKSDQ